MEEGASPLSFIFKDEDDVDFNSLRQGDLLLRTARVRQALDEGHKHYATQPDYTHFVVLTQSCDLAIRGSSPFRAPYITICAAKPLSAYLEKKLKGVFADIAGPLRIGRLPMQRAAEAIVNRLISNTSDDVFFLDAFVAKSIGEPVCAFLQLSVALQAGHYGALLAAKQAEMTDIFAAKLGWMAGNLYSRVATPDLSESNPEEAAAFQKRMTDQILHHETVWLDKRQISAYEKALAAAEVAKGAELTLDEAKTLADTCPKPIQELSSAVMAELAQVGIQADDKTLNAIKNRLENNNKLRGFASRAA